MAKELAQVKVIVRVFKHGSWNNKMPTVFHLIQEVETRFGITRAVVQRFLKADDEVAKMLQAKTTSPAHMAFQ